MNKYILWLLLIGAFQARASTFIGNGGNAGDLDLAVALAEIRQTFGNFDEESEPCQCPADWASNELCGVLRSLEPKQVAFCQDFLIAHKSQMMALAAKNSNIQFTWSDQTLNVQAKDGSKRIVDAVAQREKNTVIINRTRFLELPHSFRIALLTHELFHLIPIGKNFIDDNDTVGPFKDGKRFLDVLGAATAVTANQSGVVNEFAPLNKVSRAHKKYIFQADVKTITHNPSASEKLLKKNQSRGNVVFFEYKPKAEAFAYRIGSDTTIHLSSPVSGVTVKEVVSLTSLGLGYHWYPVTAYLSRWSEMHVSAFFDAMAGTAQYEVSDSQMSIKDSSPVQAVQIAAQVHVPIIYGFWGLLGYQSRLVNSNYKDLGIATQDIQHNTSIGVSYAF